MQYQRSWWSLSTRTSTTRSTWSLQWPACSSLQSFTAGQGAWSSAVMPSNHYWDTTLSSRPWRRKACMSQTRTDWLLRETWPAHPYIWWVEILTRHESERKSKNQIYQYICILLNYCPKPHHKNVQLIKQPRHTTLEKCLSVNPLSGNWLIKRLIVGACTELCLEFSICFPSLKLITELFDSVFVWAAPCVILLNCPPKSTLLREKHRLMTGFL